MYRSVYSVQADDYARRALDASCEIDRQMLLATEKTLRAFAEADERIQKVRERVQSERRDFTGPVKTSESEKAA